MLPGPASMDGGEPRCAKKIGENKNIVPVPESSPAAESAETSKRFDPKGHKSPKLPTFHTNKTPVCGMGKRDRESASHVYHPLTHWRSCQ